MLQLSADKGSFCSRLWLEELGRGPRRKPHGLRAKSRAMSGDAEPRAVSVGSSLWKRSGGECRIDTLHLHSTLLVHASGMGDTNTGPSKPRWVWTFTTCHHLQVRHPTKRGASSLLSADAELLSRSQGEDKQEGITRGRFLERGRESRLLVLLQELLRHSQLGATG